MSRIEKLLTAWLNKEKVTGKPLSRIEACLMALINKDPSQLTEPQSRIEKQLQNLYHSKNTVGYVIKDLDCKSRLEKYIDSLVKNEPVEILGNSRVDYLMSEISEGNKEILLPTLSCYATLRNPDASCILSMWGVFEDFENKSKYMAEDGHGFVYLQSDVLDGEELTANTPGRYYVGMAKYFEGGTFSQNMNSGTVDRLWTIRAFFRYLDGDGVTQYVYSEPIEISYKMVKGTV